MLTVLLLYCQDDYMNASYVSGLSQHSPGFIVTQVGTPCLVQ